MLSVLNRQAAALSAELDRYRSGGDMDVQALDTLREEKEMEITRLRGELESKITDLRVVEMESKKLRTGLNKAHGDLEEKDAVIDTLRQRIITMEEQTKACEKRMANMALAMKASELQVRHSDNRAIRTAQQVAGDAEVATRKAVRHAEELERTVLRLEGEAEVAEERIRDKNEAIDRLHSRVHELDAVITGYKQEVDQLRGSLNRTETEGQQANDAMQSLRQERVKAMKKKNELIRNLRQLRSEDKGRIDGYQRDLGEALYARMEQGLAPSVAAFRTMHATPPSAARPSSVPSRPSGRAPGPASQRPGTARTRPAGDGTPRRQSYQGSATARATTTPKSNKKEPLSQAAKLTFRRLMQNVREQVIHARDSTKPGSKPGGGEEEATHDIKQMFESFDIDHRGVIDELEWQTAMRELGVNVSGDELMTLFSFFDHSGDGCDYNQFVWAFYNRNALPGERGSGIPSTTTRKAAAPSPSRPQARAGSAKELSASQSASRSGRVKKLQLSRPQSAKVPSETLPSFMSPRNLTSSSPTTEGGGGDWSNSMADIGLDAESIVDDVL